jgi:hypothetical protein
LGLDQGVLERIGDALEKVLDHADDLRDTAS